MTKSYSFMITLPSFEERFLYLKLNGIVGDMTFNGHRYLNQKLYQCPEWESIRRKVIIRDNGCDLACDGEEIGGIILVHHINPITISDIMERRPRIFDLDNLVCVSLRTHNAIHYGDDSILQRHYTVRTKNDTCPWR